MRAFVVTVAGLCALALWAAMILLGLTGMTHFEPQAGTVDVSNRGVARVVGCEREGPVSLNGYGYWETCQADVVWEDGRTERLTAGPGQLTPEDRDVPVVERKVGGLTKGAPAATLFRADFEPSVVLGLGSALGGLGVGGILALIFFGSTVSRTRRASPATPDRPA